MSAKPALDRYRLLIEQYFRALQGAEEEQP